MASRVADPPKGTGDNPAWADDPDAKSEDELWENEKAIRGQEGKNRLLFLKFLGFAVPASMLFFLAIFFVSLFVLGCQ